MRRPLLLSLSALLLCSVALAQRMADNATVAGDNSDWWSLTRDLNEPSAPNIEPQKRVPAASNFSILGVALGDPQGVRLAAKLGKAAIVGRGDAATARAQVCYVSAKGTPAVHLIFEQGEVDNAYYLFSGGPDWQRSNLCAKSPLVSLSLKTGGGLALGQSRTQVEAILGEPTTTWKNRLIYFGVVHVKPKSGESYDLTSYIEARFSDHGLDYLGVVKTETD
jgi:hypothetical protein